MSTSRPGVQDADKQHNLLVIFTPKFKMWENSDQVLAVAMSISWNDGIIFVIDPRVQSSTLTVLD